MVTGQPSDWLENTTLALCALVLHGAILLFPLQKPDALQTGIEIEGVLNHTTTTHSFDLVVCRPPGT